MIRDKLLARLGEMGDTPDYQRLVVEVLGLRGAPPALARVLVSQALVIEDRHDVWRRAGERICRDAPIAPGVYVLKDANAEPLYVGKAINLRRRLRAHFAERRWRHLPPELSRVADAEWELVGSELEALLKEATLIDALRPPVNVQLAPPSPKRRTVPRALVRDVVVLVPSVEEDSVEIVAAETGGSWMIQRTRRSGADLVVHTQRLMRFFNSPLRRSSSAPALAPLVFSWLAGRGARATRLDPRACRDARELRGRLAALLRDERLFHERLVQW